MNDPLNECNGSMVGWLVWLAWCWCAVLVGIKKPERLGSGVGVLVGVGCLG